MFDDEIQLKEFVQLTNQRKGQCREGYSLSKNNIFRYLVKNWGVREESRATMRMIMIPLLTYRPPPETITLFQFFSKTRNGEENLWTDLKGGLYQTLLYGKKVEKFIIYLSNCVQTYCEGLGTSSLNCSCHQGCLI